MSSYLYGSHTVQVELTVELLAPPGPTHTPDPTNQRIQALIAALLQAVSETPDCQLEFVAFSVSPPPPRPEGDPA